MNYQQLNGFTDWFDEALETGKKAVSDVTDWAGETLNVGYNWAVEKSGQLTAQTEKQLKDFQKGVEKLLNTQKKVDEAIESLPEGTTKSRLMAKKQESRGIFSEYIAPAWNKFREWAGFEEKADYGSTMGVIPVIGLAAVLGSVGVAMYYINQSQALEEAILNDPDLKRDYALAKAKSGGDIMLYAKIGGFILGGILLTNVIKSMKG